MNATAAHAAFVEGRRSYIGGTDIGAILGISPWASPLSVYMDKVDPDGSEHKDSLPMRRGLALERFIADEFEREHPELVCWQPKPIVRTDWGFPAGASVDRLIADRAHPRTPVAVLEAKTAFSFHGAKQWDEETGDLPDSYFTQVQWYLAVTGLPLCYAAADTGKDHLTIVEVRSDERVRAVLIDVGLHFWVNHVLAGVPPAPIGTAAGGEALRRLYPREDPDVAVVLEDPACALALSDYLAHTFKEKEHAKAAEAAKQTLQAAMGTAESAVVDSWRMTWKAQTRTTVDAKALRAKYPDAAAECERTSESRVFRLKELS